MPGFMLRCFMLDVVVIVSVVWQGESERSAGVLLFVTIVYSHTHTNQRPSYNMHVSRIPGSAYKVVETQRINDTARISLNR